ncbi:hypothetical protein [Planctomicrobium sp. SH527]|uniref:hypothetical protein n=1 Tax=Planctomicrobium sp. SH527 TaxID=3448123 RepID=UPI003F5C2C27
MTLITIPRTANDTLPNDTEYTVFIVVGGSRRPLVRFLAKILNAIVVVVDNAEEMRKVTAEYRRWGVHMFSLGDNETLATLFRNAKEPFASAVKHVASMPARIGCGASPAAAAVAAEQMGASAEFDGFLHDVVSDMIQKTNARPESIRVRPIVSYSGGTGAGATLVLTLFVLHGLAALNIPVLVTFDLLGPLTFTKLSKTAGQSAAATLVSFLLMITTKDDPRLERMPMYLDLVELPPLGNRHQLRTQLMLLDYQAIHASEVEEYRSLISPNHSTSGPLGNVFSREAFFRRIIDQTEILPTVASNLDMDFDQLMENVTTDPSLIRSRRWEDNRTALNRLSIDDIVNRAKNLTGDEIITAFRKPGERHEEDLFYDLGPEGEFNVRKLEEYFVSYPTETNSALHRLTLLRTFDLTLNADAQEIAEQHHDWSAEVTRLEHLVIKTHAALCQGAGWFKSLSSLIKELADAGEDLRTASDELAIWEAKRATLNEACLSVSTEHEHLERRFAQIKAMLQRFIPRGRETFNGTLITCHGVRGVFSELMQLATRPVAEQAIGLCDLATGVTLNGLASICSAPQAKVDDIAEQIVFGESTYKAPPHGAFVRRDKPITIYVLPPIAAVYRTELREKIGQLNPDSVTFFCDNIDAGACVVHYSLRGFTSVDELFEGLFNYNLDQLRTSRTAALRYPTGEDLMELLRTRLAPPSAGETGEDLGNPERCGTEYTA